MEDNIDELIAYSEYTYYLANNANDPYGIDKIIDKLGTDYRRFFDNLISYINKNITKPQYVFIFENIIEAIICHSNLDINKYLYDQDLNPQELQTNLNKFLTYFRPDMKYTKENLAKLRATLNSYSKYYEKCKVKKKLDTTNEILSKQLILEFINSPYSLERFNFQKRITLTKFKNLLEILKKHDTEKYQLFIEHMEKKTEIKNATIQNDILKILNLIKNLGDNFTSIDLFTATFYGPRELVKAADVYLTLEDLKLFRSRVNKYNTDTFKATILTNSGIQELIKSPLNLTIDGKLVETQEKERQMIVEELTNNYIPITSLTFIEAYKKYYLEKDKIKTIKA